MYKRKIRVNIVQPTILFNFPNLVPLARPSDKNPKVIEMFQVLVVGTELSKAYSELVDPVIQREGFEEQMKNKAQGDEEAFSLDEDFMLAMEHGMPPMSGLGLGIDRFITILTNQPTLRDVVLFPNMK
jgi:lysyl-tRNA synthetase class 2